MSKKLFFIFALVASPLCLAHAAAAKEWRGITPLRTTRAEVERTLGPPARPGDPPSEKRGPSSHYETEKERVTVFYSQGGCAKGGSVWDVPFDTVISISVRPKRELPVSDLKEIDDLNLDGPNFLRAVGRDKGSPTYYVNEEEGILVVTQGVKGGGMRVVSVDYYPPASAKNLRCPDVPRPSDKSRPGREQPPPPAKKPSPLFDEVSYRPAFLPA